MPESIIVHPDLVSYSITMDILPPGTNDIVSDSISLLTTLPVGMISTSVYLNQSINYIY